MAGMAWTLHPDLFYQKYGIGLVELWDSGALGTLFKPVRRLSKNIGNAIASGIAPLRHNSEAKKDDVEADNCSVATEDEAAWRVNREPWDSSLEPSTSQQNELAFQGDLYTQLRRSRRQSERLKKIHDARERAFGEGGSGESRTRRGSGSRFRRSMSFPRKRDKSLRKTLGGAGTPLGDVYEFSPPRRAVTIDISGSSSDLSEDEEKDDVRTLRSSKSGSDEPLLESDSRKAPRGTRKGKGRATPTHAACDQLKPRSDATTPTTERSSAFNDAFSEDPSGDASAGKTRSKGKGKRSSPSTPRSLSEGKRGRSTKTAFGKSKTFKGEGGTEKAADKKSGSPKPELLEGMVSISLTSTKDEPTPVEGEEILLSKCPSETLGSEKPTRSKHRKKKKGTPKAASVGGKKSRTPADEKCSGIPVGGIEDSSFEPSAQFTKRKGSKSLFRSQEVGLPTRRDKIAPEDQQPTSKASNLSNLKVSSASMEEGAQGAGVTGGVVPEARQTLPEQAEQPEEVKSDRTRSKTLLECASSPATTRRSKGRRKKRRHKQPKSTSAAASMEDGEIESPTGALRSPSSASSIGTSKDSASAFRRRGGRKSKDRAKRKSVKARSVQADVALPPPSEGRSEVIAGTQVPELLVASAGPSTVGAVSSGTSSPL